MAVRFYIVPTETYAGSRTRLLGRTTVKYIDEVLDDGGRATITTWGSWCLARIDGSNTLHTSLAAKGDTTQAPRNLQNTIGGALTAAQTALESTGIPADWMQASMTWGEALRSIAKISQFWQAVRQTNLVGAGSGRTLSTTWTELPQGIRAKMLAVARAWGAETSSLSGASTLRQILTSMGLAFPYPIRLGGQKL